MSGGFFRGTSADQDTRFSNKQAKLMKSQKFAPELEKLVDMTKVKMDVMRPWIANRVTELLGFEDEVLINFIYGLLDGKVVNGKEVQISLTGFMEKNTGKFMKELWILLLSAQENASGVPQQFLDAKEAETKKKKAETDRISSEIQKKKEREGQELEHEKIKKTDGEVDISRANNVALDLNSTHEPRTSSAHYADEKGTGERNGSRGRSRVSRSPHSADHPSLSPNRRSRSVSKSFSNSRSYSDERRKSRSISESPHTRSGSISSERLNRSPPRRSVTPPSRRRSFHSRRRSTSRPRLRSPSPIRRRRSPLRRRSRTPIRYRSRSPLRRRSKSPVRYRSRSPMRRGSPSPIRRRSPSPMRRRSPYPVRRRSPSPVRRRYRRSPSTPRHRSPSPRLRRSPIPSRRRLPTPSRHRSPSHEQWSSPSPPRRLPPSPGRRKSPKRQRRSPVQSPRESNRTFEKLSPVRHARTRDNAERSAEIRKGPDSVVLRPPVSLRSPQRDPRDRDDTHRKRQSSSPSPYRSQSHSGSPPGSRRRSLREDRRSFSPYASPAKQTKEQKLQDISASPLPKPRDQKPRLDNPVTRGEKAETCYARGNGDQKLKSSEKRSARLLAVDEGKASRERVPCKDDHSSEKVGGNHSNEVRSRSDGFELRKKDQETRSAKTSKSLILPEVAEQEKLPTIKEDTSLSERHQVSSPEDIQKYDKKNDSHSDEAKGSKIPLASLKSMEGDEEDRSGSLSSGSQERDKRHQEVHEKRKHKRSERKEVASDDSDDSKIEGRKDAKRRRKEEKRLRKEERRRRKEEKHRKRGERRRAEKLKDKSIDTVTPSTNYENQSDGNASDRERVVRMESDASDAEVTETEQKRLEVELRKKALESLRAKRGVGH